jgi:hypothetical protein
MFIISFFTTVLVPNGAGDKNQHNRSDQSDDLPTRLSTLDPVVLRP